MGWEHRYRVSRYLQSVGSSSEKQNKTLRVKKQKRSAAESDDSVDNDNDSDESDSDDDKDATKSSAFLLGRFKIDKNKLGRIGFEHRYRASNKFKSIMLDQNIRKPSSRKNKKQQLVANSKADIIEVVDYSDNEEIPFCDELADVDSLTSIPVTTASDKDEETKKKSSKQKSDHDHEEKSEIGPNAKPQVGWEH